VIKISKSAAASDAIAAMLPLGSMAFESASEAERRA
jgi:hypothetical protein